ncbi:MAG TPA: hypothetical protein VFV34_10740 [Blastocatellia bacterium]|nr:hypothetical protein [Blastocatellia bacterium]
MTDDIPHFESGIRQGSPIVIYLHSPREKVWGLLLQLNSAGVFLRGLDLNTFDDWLLMIVRGERNIGLTHVFVPMWRVERVTLDEAVDDIPSLADRFQSRVGMTIHEYLDGESGGGRPVS